MLFLNSVALLLVSSVSAHVIRSDSTARPDASSTGNWCGNAAGGSRTPSKELLATYGDEITTRHFRGNQSSIMVDTYFHIVANSTKPQDGWVSNKTISDQLQVLRESFASSGITFRLKAVTRTLNSRWAVNPNKTADLEMRMTLRQGGYNALNLYFTKGAGVGLLGSCWFPDSVEPKSTEFYRDGCIIRSSTMPGGGEVDASLGKTTVHEVGHWFGLMHTFEGGCTGDGDFIEDTPAEATPARGCMVGRDTCPDQLGADPINNFMDYSADECSSQFTPGQNARMHSLWNKYRAQA